MSCCGGSLPCQYPSQGAMSREIKDELEIGEKAERWHITEGGTGIGQTAEGETSRVRHQSPEGLFNGAALMGDL
jgi:hypothetical protein